MNGDVWKGCRRIEAERYRQVKSWWKCLSTGLKSCSPSLSGLVTSEGRAKEVVHDHTCGISWLIWLQTFVLFEAYPQWIEVSHWGRSRSSLTLREQRQRGEFLLHWPSEGGGCFLFVQGVIESAVKKNTHYCTLQILWPWRFIRRVLWLSGLWSSQFDYSDASTRTLKRLVPSKRCELPFEGSSDPVCSTCLVLKRAIARDPLTGSLGPLTRDTWISSSL